MLTLETPVRLRIDGLGAEEARMRQALTYTNKAKVYELQRLKNNPYFVNQHGEEAYAAELARLKSEVKVCLLKEQDGDHWTYSGLTDRLRRDFGMPFRNKVQYPEAANVPWFRVPDGEDRYYQTRMLENLLAVRHGAVEVGTGLGKSRVIRNIVKALGLKTVILAPTLSIAEQLFDDLAACFGRAKVGFYGDGKKDAKKLITVGTYQSLARINKLSPDFALLHAAPVFIVDESHLTPAATLKQVCEDLCGNAPYRFFFSGTQMRNDGADLLLEGIIGPVVYEMTVQQGVDEHFLSKPNFMMVDMVSQSNYISNNPDYMLDRHFYSNAAMYKRAAEIANKSANLLGHQVLVLIDEVTQFQHLYPHLQFRTGFAHGGVTKTNAKSVPKDFHKSDPKALVAALNAGELPILVGTSCIAIGTDIRTPKTLINLQGGTSEPKIRQAVGRGTRKIPGQKDAFNYWDFCIRVRHPEDPEFESITERHARTRAAIYESIYPGLRWVK